MFVGWEFRTGVFETQGGGVLRGRKSLGLNSKDQVQISGSVCPTFSRRRGSVLEGA